MPKALELAGQRFGRLTVLELAGSSSQGRLWKCVCDCGNQTTVRAKMMTSGKTRSCGCLMIETTRKTGQARRTHGEGSSKGGRQRSPTYNSWRCMRERCDSPSSTNYRYYGARGITYPERWKSYENFREDMGERPDGCTLERIDNDGDYSPDNCRWATYQDQALNRRPR